MNNQPIIEKLSNGLTIASDFMPEAEAVSVHLLVKTGSRYEDEENNGISHFLEHMAFKGTTTRNARQIAEAFDDIGGHFNAHTSHEETAYYAKVLKQDWPVAVEVLTDILQNSVYSEEEIERERGVIIQEIAQYEDQPDSLVMDNFAATAFPGQPLGRKILGEVTNVQSITRDSLVQYINKHYCMDNLIVAAAGNIEHRQFSQLVQEKLYKLPTVGSSSFAPAIYRGGQSKLIKDLEQANICLGFPSVPYISDEYHTYKMLATILGGGMSSRLFQEVREKRGLAYSISAFCQGHHDCGMWMVFAACAPQSSNQLLDVVLQQLVLATQNISEAEIQRARAQLRAGLLMSLEHTSARAEKLASNLANFDRYIPVAESLAKISKVSTDDLVAAMTKMLNTENSKPTIAAVGKVSDIYNYEDIVGRI